MDVHPKRLGENLICNGYNLFVKIQIQFRYMSADNYLMNGWHSREQCLNLNTTVTFIPQVRWNACYAIRNLFRNPLLPHGQADWTVSQPIAFYFRSG